MKEKLKNKLVIIIGFVLLVVIVVAKILDWKIKIKFSASLTAIAEFTTVIALLALIFQIYMERKKNKEEKNDNTFFNLIELFSNMKEKLIINEDIFSKIVRQINTEKEQYMRNELYKKQLEYVKKNNSKLFSIIESQYPSGVIYDGETLPNYYHYGLGSNKSELNEDEYKKILKCIVEVEGYPYRSDGRSAEFLKKSGPNFDDYLLGLEKIKKEELSENDINIICNEIFNFYYKDVGHFCRLFHRIVKFVNDNVRDSKLKSNYFGILRAILSEDELLVIFYNSFYSAKGKGLSEQLVNKTQFFGDENDLPDDTSSEFQHFSKDSLVFYEIDLKNMKKCI